MKVNSFGEPVDSGVTEIVVDEDISILKDIDEDCFLELVLFGDGENYLSKEQTEDLIRGLELSLTEFSKEE